MERILLSLFTLAVAMCGCSDSNDTPADPTTTARSRPYNWPPLARTLPGIAHRDLVHASVERGPARRLLPLPPRFGGRADNARNLREPDWAEGLHELHRCRAGMLRRQRIRFLRLEPGDCHHDCGGESGPRKPRSRKSGPHARQPDHRRRDSGLPPHLVRRVRRSDAGSREMADRR